jgi:diguanylate cyclase (GGDEF)-like protein
MSVGSSSTAPSGDRVEEPFDPVRGFHVATALATPRQIGFAASAGLVSLVLFFAATPFAGHSLAKLPTILSITDIILIFCDLITAMLVFQHYMFFRSRSMLVLASGYIYDATIAACHLMTFPGAIVAQGLLGAGPQSSAWIYLSWHATFPLVLIAYSTLSLRETRSAGAPALAPPGAGGRGARVLPCLAAAVGVAAAQAALAIHWQGQAPPLMIHDRFLPLMKILALISSGVCLLAIAALLRGGRITVLRLWLVVTMGVWMLDLIMTNTTSDGRYDLGWYAGKMFGVVAGSAVFVMYVLENTRNYRRLASLTEALQQLSQNDGLTGLANRRALDDYLHKEVARVRRGGSPLCLVMCDIDHFKRFNDNYGHLAGDHCLIRVSEALKACCHRRSDMAARYGGEEFALILPATGIEGALRTAEWAREAVLALRIPNPASDTSPFVTISVGVAEVSARDGAETSPLALIAASDQALFTAKAQGRNRVIPASPDRQVRRTAARVTDPC